MRLFRFYDKLKNEIFWSFNIFFSYFLFLIFWFFCVKLVAERLTYFWNVWTAVFLGKKFLFWIFRTETQTIWLKKIFLALNSLSYLSKWRLQWKEWIAEQNILERIFSATDVQLQLNLLNGKPFSCHYPQV